MSTNSKLQKIISTNVTKKSLYKKKSNSYEKTELYLSKPVNMINHTDSKTFYTDEYIKLLEDLFSEVAGKMTEQHFSDLINT